MLFYRSLALFCLIAAPALVAGEGAWTPSLKIRFDLTIFGIGTTAFIEMPQNKSNAESKGWKETPRTDVQPGLESLDLWCNTTDYTVCILYDDTGYLAGLQVAFSKANFTGYFDMAGLGFTDWSPTTDGNTEEYYAIQQYFVSAETLAKSKETRLAARKTNTNLQDTDVWLTGFDGQLYNVSLNTSAMTTGNTEFTKQACIPWMGRHYYRNMSQELKCDDKDFFPWFPLVYSDQLIGAGLVVFGNFTEGSAPKLIENPSRSVVKTIVYSAPECMYELTDSPGVITMHIYYIDTPLLITCILK